MASILKSPHTVALYSKSTRALTSQIFFGGQASKAWPLASGNYHIIISYSNNDFLFKTLFSVYRDPDARSPGACEKAPIPGCEKMRIFTGDQSDTAFLRSLIWDGAGMDAGAVCVCVCVCVCVYVCVCVCVCI